MMRREIATVGGCYIAARILYACTIAPVEHPDTPSYREGVSLTGSLPRPWVVPLLQETFTDRGVVIVQAALSGFAFVALAVAVASTLHAWQARLTALVVVLALGLSERVVSWDAAMLSESVAISLTALLIAAVVLDWRTGWVVAVFTLWVFTRDLNVYLGAFVVAGFVLWRRWTLPAICAVVLMWGFVAAGNDRLVEGYNVTTNIAYRIEDHAWFIERGMPDSEALSIADPVQERPALNRDPAMWAWATGPGANVYAEYLATHPGFTFEAFDHVLNERGWSLVDSDTWRTDNQLAGINAVWPNEATTYTRWLLLAALVSVAVSVRRLHRRWIIPAVLAASTIPHALLAFHGSALDVPRHGAVMAFVLVLACWWLIVLSVDRAGVEVVDLDAVSPGARTETDESPVRDRRVSGCDLQGSGATGDRVEIQR